jgi:hypothetical protein
LRAVGQAGGRCHEFPKVHSIWVGELAGEDGEDDGNGVLKRRSIPGHGAAPRTVESLPIRALGKAASPIMKER